MKKKFRFLVNESLKRKVKTKWFMIANIILGLVIVGICNIDSIINYFGGDFDNTTKIYIIDNTGKSFDLFNQYVEEGFKLTESSNYQIINYDKTKDEAVDMIKNVEEEYNSVILIFDNDDSNVLSVTMISNDFSNLTDLSVITNSVNNTKTVLAIDKYKISEEQMAGLTTPVTINRELLDESKDSTEENMNLIMTTVFPVLILPFFMLTILLVQMIGAEINDEKTTRGMEIIISNVSPKVHFFSKCLAGNLFVLIQGGLLLLFGGIGVLIRYFVGGGITVTDMLSTIDITLPSSFLSVLPLIIPMVLVLMVVTFLGYSLIAGILASMTTNTEDFQQVQSPIVIVSLIGYYLSMMAGAFKGAIIIKILGYVPFISAILAPSLFVMGDFGIIDVIIAILLMLGVVYILIRYGLKIYKVGILNYSSGDLWKKMAKALKN